MSILTRTKNLQNENIILNFIKGLIISLMISFGLVILFAFILKWSPLLENYIFVGTMLIKILSASVGAILAIKGDSFGLFKGLLFGLIYISFAFIIFSFLAGNFDFDKQTILDYVLCGLTGAIIGVIKVNKN